MKKHSTIRNISKFIFVSISLSFLASCMSTTQFASRKYTKGHFSDPIAKVNVDILPSVSNAATELVKQSQNIITKTQNILKVSTTVTETRLNKTIQKKGINFTSQQKSVKLVSNGPNTINKDNASLSENSVTTVTQTNDHGNGGGSVGGHGYLWIALVCLLVAIVAAIVGAVFFLVSYGLALIFYIISVIAVIGFLVFGILWLIGVLGVS